MSIEFKMRLVPEGNAEHEWLYLINETYLGETCIVPLLESLLTHPSVSPAFGKVISRQIDEERDHIQRYTRLLSSRPLAGSGYDFDFAKFVLALPNVTLQLFSLQAILEGISLGALNYRLQALSKSPSYRDDLQIQADEVGHTRFGYGFLKNLISTDGLIPDADFATTAKGVNEIFKNYWNGAVIEKSLTRDLGATGLSVEKIQASEGMKFFVKACVQEVYSNKAEFLKRYHAAAS